MNETRIAELGRQALLLREQGKIEDANKLLDEAVRLLSNEREIVAQLRKELGD